MQCAINAFLVIKEIFVGNTFLGLQEKQLAKPFLNSWWYVNLVSILVFLFFEKGPPPSVEVKSSQRYILLSKSLLVTVGGVQIRLGSLKVPRLCMAVEKITLKTWKRNLHTAAAAAPCDGALSANAMLPFEVAEYLSLLLLWDKISQIIFKSRTGPQHYSLVNFSTLSPKQSFGKLLIV